MNRNLYKKGLCLLLASSVTFGPAVGPLSAQALDEMTTELAQQMSELTPAQESQLTSMMKLTPAQKKESIPLTQLTPAKTIDGTKSEEQTDKPQEETEKPELKGKNLALAETVNASASKQDEGYEADNARDGKTDSVWKGQVDVEGAWLSYDFKTPHTFKGIRVVWDSVNDIKEYFVETSVDGTKWEEQAHKTAESQKEETLVFSKAADAQHIRLRIVPTEDAQSVGVQELEVYGSAKALELLPINETRKLSDRTNLALLDGVKATVSNVEKGTELNGDKARDGNRTDKKSRWATDVDASKPKIEYDLGKPYSIGGVVIYWEQPSASHYLIQTSDNGTTWTTQKTITDKVKPDALVEKIDFDQTVQAQYVRVCIEDYKNDDWNNISMYELEVYQVAPSTIQDADSVAQKLNIHESEGKVVIDPVDGFDISFAANYEQVVDAEGRINKPLTDMHVDLDVKVVNQEDEQDTANRTVRFKVEGEHDQNEGNDKPAVIPELTEWYSSHEQEGKTFQLTESSRIVYGSSELQSIAEEVQNDIEDLFGFKPQIASGAAQPGDIGLKLESGLAGFDKETYEMDVTDQVEIKASDKTGVYWGTRSVLQALMLSGDAHTIGQGKAKDYPEYKVRGFTFDVGRKAVSMDMLKEFAKNMAWFKMNDFHVHLSDNLIFLEDYAKKEEDLDNAWNAYDGFRLESDMKGKKTGRPLASPDYHYTKKEFGEFIRECNARGVNVVPELDVPAHALSFTKILQEENPDWVINKVGTFWGNTRPWIDHVNVANPDAVNKVKDLFREYIESTEQAFGGEETVIHIGADEFYDSKTEYRAFLKEMIRFIRDDMHRQVRIWGSLKAMNEGSFTEEDVKGAQMNIWSLDWADPQAMHDMGFNLINTLDRNLYMVPNGTGNQGAYGDYLDSKSLYDSWTPNNMAGNVIPASSEHMLGASYAIWQDQIDTRAAGIDESDLFARFYDAMLPLSVKMWGEADALDRDFSKMQLDAKTIGLAPDSNPMFEVENKAGTREVLNYTFEGTQDSSGNGRDLTLKNASVKEGVLNLTGGESYAEVGGGLNKLGHDHELTFRIKKDSGRAYEEVIFEADHAYDEYTIKAIKEDEASNTWKLGFSRELYDYIFDVELPEGEWITLTLHNADGNTTLSVNGSDPISAVGSFLSDSKSNSAFQGKTGITHSSFMMPIARIGSKHNAFVGQLDDISVTKAGNVKDPAQSEENDIPRDQMTATTGSYQPGSGDAKFAIDGDPKTLWHTKWDQSVTEADGWLELKLEQPTEIAGLRYLPRHEGKNGIITEYKIQTKLKEEDEWTDAAIGTWSASHTWKMATFNPIMAKYVRLVGVETLSDGDQKFVSAAEVRLCKPIDMAGQAKISFPQSSYPLIAGQATPKPIVKLEDGTVLRELRDYTLSYKDHTAPGTGTVIVTGKGVFKGSIEATYQITDSGVHRVTFHTDGGTEMDTLQVPDGGWITEPEKPIKSGYGFYGWYTDWACENRYEFGTTIKADLDLYAGWREESGGSASKPEKPEKPEKSEDKPEEQQNTPQGEVKPVAPVISTVQGDPETIKRFRDLKGHWAQDAIAWAVTNHLFSGVSDKSFAPDTFMTRGMLVTVLHRLSGTPAANGSSQFADVPASAYYKDAVVWASNVNLILGVGNQKFAPNANMTREQLAVTLYKFAGQPKTNTGSVNTAGVSDWAKDAMEWAVAQGLIQGSGNGNLDPQKQATRAQVATILMRFEQMMKK